MTIHRLCTRLARLEQHAQAQEDGVLHVWRLPDESIAEACARNDVDPDDSTRVQVHVWLGGQVAARLATPPASLWRSQTRPVIADLEYRLHKGMKQGVLPLSKRS
jgi:hypothetical protein